MAKKIKITHRPGQLWHACARMPMSGRWFCAGGGDGDGGEGEGEGLGAMSRTPATAAAMKSSIAAAAAATRSLLRRAMEFKNKQMAESEKGN